MGVPELSAIEERVVLLSAAGWSRAEIAIDAGVDESVVAWHMARAAGKLDRASTLRRHIQPGSSRAPACPPDITKEVEP